MPAFTVSAAHSGRVIMVRVAIGEIAALLATIDGGRWNRDVALIRTLEVRESVTIARHAYRVTRCG